MELLPVLVSATKCHFSDNAACNAWQDKLFDIISDVLSEEEYLVRRFAFLFNNKGRLHKVRSSSSSSRSSSSGMRFATTQWGTLFSKREKVCECAWLSACMCACACVCACACASVQLRGRWVWGKRTF